MLGEAQADWLVDRIASSEATWKLWGSQTMVAEMLADLSKAAEVPPLLRDKFYYKLDHWDGYRSERRRILDAVAGVDNLAVLTGDIHAFYAAQLRPDFDAPTSPATAVEYIFAGITSISVQRLTQQIVDSTKVLAQLGLSDVVKKFDEILRASNPHYRHAKSDAYGFGIVEVDGEQTLRATMVELLDDVRSRSYTGAVRRTRFSTPVGTHEIRPA